MYKHAAQSLRHRRERGIERANRQPQQIPVHLLDAFKDQRPVLGRFGQTVNGGVEVSIEKVRAFCPHSECYPRLGRTGRWQSVPQGRVEFLIIDVTARDLVVSRRRVVMAEALRKARASLHSGSTLTGTVESLMPYGAFVDLGGISGLLHLSRAFSGQGGNLAYYLSPGDEIEVRVVAIDGQRQRISLESPVPLDLLPRRPKKRRR